MTEYAKEFAKSYAVGSQKFYQFLGQIVEVAQQGQEVIKQTEQAGQGVISAIDNLETTINKIFKIK